MLIAVFSDSHDHLPNLEVAIGMVKELGIKRGFHLGDVCAPFSVRLLTESGLQWQCVWGNNDGDKMGGYQATAGSKVDFDTRDFREIKIEERRLFLTHYPEIARIAALSGSYDACFFGHNHRYSSEIIGQSLLANPGEILGWRFKQPSFGVYDTVANEMQTVFLSVEK